MARAYSPKLRLAVMAAARRVGASPSQSARKYGVSESSLYRWLRLDDGNAWTNSGLMKTEAAELRAVRTRVRTLEYENGILLRVAALLADAAVPRDDLGRGSNSAYGRPA